MKLFFVLSNENIALGKAEVVSLLSAKQPKLMGNILLIDAETYKPVAQRLAYTHSYHHLLFSCKERDFVEKFSSYKWKNVYKKSFCLRIHNPDFHEKDMASYIWDSVPKPKVDLEHPKTLIECFFVDGIVLCGKMIEKVEKHFEVRKNQNRPAPHPTSLHPKLARAMVNLTGAKKGEEIFDPMCGSGGILIEAGLMGMNARGTDIDNEMAERARKNLKFFGVKKFKVGKGDALMMKKYPYVVTDLPYGKNTKSVSPEFYDSFLGVLRKKLGKKAVVGFPDFVDAERLVKKHRLTMEYKFSYYLHKSLSKKIVVIS